MSETPMKRWRWLLAVVVIGLVVAAAYVAGTSQPDAGAAKPNEADAATYAYEAHDVVLRQMDGSGALQYEIEAASVTQLPRDGAIEAHDLTLHYDPPGKAAGPQPALDTHGLGSAAARSQRCGEAGRPRAGAGAACRSPRRPSGSRPKNSTTTS